MIPGRALEALGDLQSALAKMRLATSVQLISNMELQLASDPEGVVRDADSKASYEIGRLVVDLCPPETSDEPARDAVRREVRANVIRPEDMHAVWAAVRKLEEALG